MLITCAALLAAVVGALGVLLALSAGVSTPFLGPNGRTLTGSISEKRHVNINGVQQGMFIRGKDDQILQQDVLQGEASLADSLK